MNLKNKKMHESFLLDVKKYKDSMKYSRLVTNKILRALNGFKEFGFSYILYTATRFKFPLFGSMRVTLFSGKKLLLPADDIGSHVLSMYGIIPHGSERKLTEWIIKNISDTDVFYDVGSHLGFYSAIAGQTCETHSFEANARLCKYLERNFKNVTCKAIASSAGEIDFYDATSTSDSSESSRFNTSGTHIKVPAITLDDYVRLGHRPPTVIKFDIEGGEYDAICGAQALIKGKSPRIILEVWGGEMGRKYSDKAVKKLQELGYTAFALERDGVVASESTSDPVGSISDIDSPRDNFMFIKISGTVI